MRFIWYMAWRVSIIVLSCAGIGVGIAWYCTVPAWVQAAAGLVGMIAGSLLGYGLWNWLVDRYCRTLYPTSSDRVY